MSEDLSALDGNALAARVAVVMDRVLGRSRVAGLSEEELDTEDVLDECARRLLGEPDAVSLAGAGAQIERLRGLIREVAALGPADKDNAEAVCRYCSGVRVGIGGAYEHALNCVHPRLVRAAQAL